jgi:hypothetical protein
VPVDRKACTAERRRAERALVQPRPAVGEPPAVARQHLDIGEQVVPERRRLGGLQMGEARHHRRRVLGGAVDQRPHRVGDLRIQPVDRVAHPEAHIRRHLVVAAARGVQALAGLPDALGQARLHVHVDVLERLVEIEGPGLDLTLDRLQPLPDRRLLVGGKDPHMAQHGGVGEAAVYVLAPHLAVEADRGVDRAHGGRRALGEAPAPLRVRPGLVRLAGAAVAAVVRH